MLKRPLSWISGLIKLTWCWRIPMDIEMQQLKFQSWYLIFYLMSRNLPCFDILITVNTKSSLFWYILWTHKEWRQRMVATNGCYELHCHCHPFGFKGIFIVVTLSWHLNFQFSRHHTLFDTSCDSLMLTW